MFEQFTDRARRVTVLAEHAAVDRQQGYIGTEHLLLAMLADGDGVAATVLHELGVSQAAVCRVLEKVSPHGDDASTERRNFTQNMKQVLVCTVEEAAQFGHAYVGTEHLLLGLVRHGNGAGCLALVELGVGRDAVRSATLRRLRELGIPGGTATTSNDEPTYERLLRDVRANTPKRAEVGVLELLREISRNDMDEEPQAVFEWLGIDEDFFDTSIDVFQDALDEPSESVVKVVERAKDLWDRPDPDLLQIVHAAVMPPAPALRRALWLLGVLPAEVAADAAAAEADRQGTEKTEAAVLAVTTLNLVVSLVVTVLVVRSAASSGWWKLLLVGPSWSGYPGYGPLVGAMVAGALALFVSPFAAVLHLLGVGGEVVQARAEEQEALPLSGARLSVRCWRHHVQRRYARLGERGAGMARMHLRRRNIWHDLARTLRFRRVEREVAAYWGLAVHDLSHAALGAASRARDHARRARDPFVAGRHVLLAIAQTDRRCSELLAEYGATRPALAAVVEDRNRKPASGGKPRFNPEMNAVVRRAAEAAKRRRAEVTCGALLVSLLDDPDARDVLVSLDVDIEAVRSALA